MDGPLQTIMGGQDRRMTWPYLTGQHGQLEQLIKTGCVNQGVFTQVVTSLIHPLSLPAC